MPIYLSADNPRWTPTSEADLQVVIDEGLLEETQYLDAKEAPSNKGDNKETARDMASFAIDSGTLIIGIAEDKTNRTFTLAPQPLKGLPEKIEQIARSIPDPPLNVITQEIRSEADPTQGYLIVHIPASPVAPHMVEGRYWGRGDKTKYRLTDPEVVRLHERRRSADQDALALLRREIENDPIPPGQRKQAHLFLVAQPLAGPRDMLIDLASGPAWSQNLHTFVQKAHTPELNAALKGTDASPSLRDAGNAYRRGRGAALATNNLGDGRRFTPFTESRPEIALELRVHEDGGLRLFHSRLSAELRYDAQDTEQVLLDDTAVNLTRRFLALVRAAAEEAGYFGNWAMALGATGLNGLQTHSGATTLGFGNPARYDEDTYTETTAVTWAELTQAPGAVTRRLAGPLLRALATEDRYAAALDDQTPPST